MAGVPFNPLQASTPQPTAPGLAPVDTGGLAKLQAMRAKAPNAQGMSDAQFAVAVHQHYYPDLPMADYLGKMGLDRGEVLYELRAPGDQYGDYLRKALATPSAEETPEQAAARQGGSIPVRRASPIEGAARAYLQGGSFGFGDELVAAGAAALNPDQSQSFPEKFNTYLGREQQLVDNFREDNPVAAYGAEIAGAVPTALVAGGQIAGKGANVFSRVMSGAGVSAGQGAVYGAGATEGDLEDRGWGAAGGAALGLASDLGANAVLSGVRSAFAKAGQGQAVKEAVAAAPMAQDIKATSQAAYQADTSGATIKPTATALLKHHLSQLLTGEALMDAGKVVGGFGLVRKAMKHLDSMSASR